MLSGKTGTSPLEWHDSRLTAETQHWAEANRAALRLRFADPGSFSVKALKIQLFSKLHEGIQEWDKITPENISAFVLELSTRTEGSSRNSGILGLQIDSQYGRGPSAVYHVFRTRDDQVMGVLQVSGTGKSPQTQGIKIKYRLLQIPQSASSIVAPEKNPKGAAIHPESTKKSPEQVEVEYTLDLARANLDMTTKKMNAGIASILDVVKAQRDVDILEAEAKGDTVGAAKARLAVAQHILNLMSQQYQAGMLDASTVEKAKLDVIHSEATLRKLEAAGRTTPGK